MLKKKPECSLCECTGLGNELTNHCTCFCYLIKGCMEVEDDFIQIIDNSINDADLLREKKLKAAFEGGWSDEDNLIVADEMTPKVMSLSEVMEHHNLEGEEKEKILNYQKDEFCTKIKTWVTSPQTRPDKVESLGLDARSLSVMRYIDLYVIGSDGCLYREFVNEKGQKNRLIVLNGEGFSAVVNEIHEKIGHGGHKSVYKIMKRLYYSPGMCYLIKEQLASCHVCMKFNNPVTIKHKYGTLVPCEARSEAQIDLIGPLPKSGAGFRYILNLTDSFTREVTLKALKTASANEMAEVLCKLFGELGLYQSLRIDYKCFSLKGLDVKYLKELGVRIVRSNNTSRVQGIVERSNQVTTIRILKLLNDDTSLSRWSEVLTAVSTGINVCPNRSLGGVSPYDLSRRFSVRYLGPSSGSIPSAVGNDFKSLVMIMEKVRRSALMNLIGHKSYNYRDENLEAGKLVFRKRMSFGRHNNQKLQTKVLEAYKIISKVASGVYACENIVTKEKKTLAVDQLIRTALRENEVRKMLIKLNEN